MIRATDEVAAPIKEQIAALVHVSREVEELATGMDPAGQGRLAKALRGEWCGDEAAQEIAKRARERLAEVLAELAEPRDPTPLAKDAEAGAVGPDDRRNGAVRARQTQDPSGNIAAELATLDSKSAQAIAGYVENLARSDEWLLSVPLARLVAATGEKGGEKRTRALSRLMASPVDLVAVEALRALAKDEKIPWQDAKAVLRLDLLIAHGAIREANGREIGDAILRMIKQGAGGKLASFVKGSPYSVRRKVALALMCTRGAPVEMLHNAAALRDLAMALLHDPAMEIWVLAAKALGHMSGIGGTAGRGAGSSLFSSLVNGEAGSVVLQRRALAGIGIWARTQPDQAFDIFERIMSRAKPFVDGYQAANAAHAVGDLALLDIAGTHTRIERYLADQMKTVDTTLFFLSNAALALAAVRGDAEDVEGFRGIVRVLQVTLDRLKPAASPAINLLFFKAKADVLAATELYTPGGMRSVLWGEFYHQPSTSLIRQGSVGQADHRPSTIEHSRTGQAWRWLEAAKLHCEQAPLRTVADGMETEFDEQAHPDGAKLFNIWDTTARVVLDREAEGLATFVLASRGQRRKDAVAVGEEGQTEAVALAGKKQDGELVVSCRGNSDADTSNGGQSGALRAARELEQRCRNLWGKPGQGAKPEKILPLVLATRRKIHDACPEPRDRLAVWADVTAFCSSSDHNVATESAHALGVVLSAAGGFGPPVPPDAVVAPLVRYKCSDRFLKALKSAGREGTGCVLPTRMSRVLAEAAQEAEPPGVPDGVSQEAQCGSSGTPDAQQPADHRTDAASLEPVTWILAHLGAFSFEHGEWPLKAALAKVGGIAHCLSRLPGCAEITARTGCALSAEAGWTPAEAPCVAKPGEGEPAERRSADHHASRNNPFSSTDREAAVGWSAREDPFGPHLRTLRQLAAEYAERPFHDLPKRIDLLHSIGSAICSLAPVVDREVPEECGNPLPKILRSWSETLAGERRRLDEAATRRRNADQHWALEQQKDLEAARENPPAAKREVSQGRARLPSSSSAAGNAEQASSGRAKTGTRTPSASDWQRGAAAFDERIRDEKRKWLAQWAGTIAVQRPEMNRNVVRISQVGNCWTCDASDESGGLAPVRLGEAAFASWGALEDAAGDLRQAVRPGEPFSEASAFAGLAWKLREQCPANLQDLLATRPGSCWVLDLQSQANDIPWELLPAGKDKLGQYRPLALSATVARSLRVAAPGARKDRCKSPAMGILVGAGSDFAAAEVDAICRRLCDAGLPAPHVLWSCGSVEELERFLAQGFGMLHVIAHKTPDPGSVEIQLAGGLRIGGARLDGCLPSSAPWLVFLNSCSSARTPEATAHGAFGWGSRQEGIDLPAAALMKRGSMVISTLFAQESGAACLAADRFYLEMLSGLPVGPSLLAARCAVAASGDKFSAMCYILYGDPGHKAQWIAASRTKSET